MDNGSVFGGVENPRNDRDERENVDRKMGRGVNWCLREGEGEMLTHQTNEVTR